MGNTFGSLKSKYKEFMVPAMDILVGGTNLSTGLGLNIRTVDIKLSLAGEDSAEFSVLDCYDVKSHSIISAVKDKLKLGSKVEIKMGYGSDKSTVFIGYLAEAGLTFSEEEGYAFSVTAFDAVKLMKESYHRRTFSSDTYAEAFSEVMKSYSGLCSAKTDSMDIELLEALGQDGSDYDFITRDLIAGGAPGWEFSITLGKASFLDGSSEPETVMELKPKYGLIQFEWKKQYLNKTIKALGYLPGEGLVVSEAKAACKEPAKEGLKTDEILVLGSAVSKSQVKEKARARKKELEGAHISGSLKTIGLPQLVPGKKITLSDIDGTIDGDYLIKEAEHLFDEDGYFTTLKVGGG